MDFTLTTEQQMIRDLCRNFVKNEVAPIAEEMDATGQFPYEVWKKMGELGIVGIPIPEEYGGGAMDWVSTMIAIEEISRGDASLGVSLLDSVTLPMNLILTFGTEQQKEKWLTPLATGEHIGAFGLTEAQAGSDANAIQTKAVLDGDEWVINGTKQFITNAGLKHNSLVVIAAVTGEGSGSRKRISNIIVPTGTPGYTFGEKYKKMGWKASETRELIFDDCRVPKENILGNPERGYNQFMMALQTSRIGFGAHSVGLAQAIFDVSLAYAKEREQFGRPISKFQAIQFKLADMIMEIELARLMVYKAAWQKDNKENYFATSTYAKVFASEVAKRCADKGVQIHGGYGLMDEYPISRYWREVKFEEILDGTSEIQRLNIARKVLKL
ncbi:MAG: acyl-CoA dehydrogenase family protein [Desulfobacterota bacterium]|nr:acyl-CoA dehydrogenase family protein [Thermodesulfobacteriota bacterium]